MYDIGGFNFICKNRQSKSRGGIAIYIKQGIKYKTREDLEVNYDGEFESLVIEVTTNNCNIIVGEVYRVPNTSESIAIERYEELASKISSTKSDIIIGTDQNFDYFKVGQHKATSDLLDMFLTMGMIPTITRATRTTHNTSTLIDNIYVNSKMNLETLFSGILATDISDHVPIFILYGKQSKIKKIPISFRTRSLNDSKMDEINNCLHHTDWSFLLPLDVNEACLAFTNKIIDILDTFAPFKLKTIYPKQQILNAWMSSGLLNSSKTLDKLHRKKKGNQKLTQRILSIINFETFIII
jgi:hypothetical protein